MEMFKTVFVQYLGTLVLLGWHTILAIRLEQWDRLHGEEGLVGERARYCWGDEGAFVKLALISMNPSDHFFHGEPGKEGVTPGISMVIVIWILGLEARDKKGDKWQDCLGSRSEWASTDGRWAWWERAQACSSSYKRWREWEECT